jgi:MraZ protein
VLKRCIIGLERDKLGHMFIGEYNFNIDGSHRINIPNSFKKGLEGQFVVAKGFEKCLYIVSREEWINLSNKLNQLSITKVNNRKFIRAFNSGAYETELDAKGRICINKVLFDYAGLDKECVIIGVGNRIEIWDTKEYEKYLNENSDVMITISEELDI